MVRPPLKQIFNNKEFFLHPETPYGVEPEKSKEILHKMFDGSSVHRLIFVRPLELVNGKIAVYYRYDDDGVCAVH
jgi:hypothetical protein